MVDFVLPIIMPVKDRLALTRQTIETLQRSATMPYKLFIVADACNQETVDYLKSVAETSDNIDLTVLDTPHGPGKTRNVGMSKAGDSPYYYHTDCDIYFLSGWMDRLFKALETYPQLGIVGGRKHPHHGIIKRMDENGVVVNLSDQQVGMSLLFRQEVWKTVGPFKENAPTRDAMGQEDTAFCTLARNAGWEVGSVDPAVVLHCGIKNTFGTDTAGYEEELRQPFPEGALYGI